MKKTRAASYLLLCSMILGENIYAKEKTYKLDEVVISAQKQEEKLSDIPLTISYFDEIAIEDKDIKSVEDISKFTPNFTLMSNGTRGASTPSMRGVHAEVQSFQLSTGIYIDGVPSLSSVGFDTIFDDIENIQVLKGPQSTLYGKNAEVGAIVINTKQASNEKEGYLTLGVGTDSKKEVRGKISGAIIEDKLYGGISISHKEKDGFITQKSSGKKIDNLENDYYKLSVRATPSDNFEISLMSSYLKYNDGASKLNSFSATDSRVLDVDLIGHNRTKQQLNSIKMKYDLSENTSIESITAINKVNENSVFDGDASTYLFFHTHRTSKYKSFLQEFRLKQKFDNFRYLLGMDFNRLDSNNRTKVLSYYNPTYNISINNISTKEDAKDNAKGIFFHSTYDINHKWSLITGFRYDKEEKKINAPMNPLRPSSFYEKREYSEFSPKIAVNYKISDNNSIFANISKGYRPGGFNAFANIQTTSYKEEKIISYEIGNKFSTKDLQLNTSIYFMDIKDMQVQESISPSVLIINNAASATSKGLELDLNYRLTSNLDLFASTGFNETKFDKFSDINGNYSNNYNPNAPKYTYNMGIQYRNNEGYFARLDLNGQGKVYADKQNQYSRKAFNTVDLKVGYELESFDIYLYGKNIFDKKYDFAGYYGGQYTIPSEPREVGVKLTYRF